MKKLKLIRSLVLVLVSALVSCTDEDQQIAYFTLNVDEAYNNSAFIDGGNWIITHDDNGQVLDFRNYEAGEKVVFERAGAPQKFAVTFIEVTSVPGLSSVKSYLNVSLGDEWTLSKPTSAGSSPSIGFLDVTINDSELGPALNSQLSSSVGRDFFLHDNYHYQEKIFPEHNDLLMFATDKSYKPLHKIFRDATPGAVTLTLADMSPFDREIEVNFLETSRFLFIARGYPEGVPFGQYNGFVASLYWNGLFDLTNRSSIKLGYLNEFANYYFQGRLSYPLGLSFFDIYYEYYGAGAPPQTINFFDEFTVSVADNSFENFTLTGDYSYFESRWGIVDASKSPADFINWSVHAPKGTHTFAGDIPDEILTKFPGIDFADKIEGFVRVVKGTKTYEDELNEQFRGVAVKPFTRLAKHLPLF